MIKSSFGTISDSEKANYELLCKDNTREPIDNYASCYLAKVPAHAVVTRQDPDLAARIWNTLNSVRVRKGGYLFCKRPFDEFTLNT